MRKVMRRASMMVVSLAVVFASFGLRPMEAKALPVLDDWTDVQAVSTALMAYMESAGMTIMVEADNWKSLASTLWETIADAYVSDVGAEAAGAATGAAWLASLAPQIALIGGGIVVGAAAGVGMFKLLDWIMDKYFPSGTGEGVELYSSLFYDGFALTVSHFPDTSTGAQVPTSKLVLGAPVYDGLVILDIKFGLPPGDYPKRLSYGPSWSSYPGYLDIVAPAYVGYCDFFGGSLDGAELLLFYPLNSPVTRYEQRRLGPHFPSGAVAVPASAVASVASSVSAPTIPTGSAMRIETGASSSATPEETLQHVGDQIINNTFSPTYTIVLDPSQDPANPPSGEDTGILDWIKSIYYRLTQLVTGLAESVSEAIQTALLPSEEFVQELPNRVKTTFADRTGFLTYPISVLVDFVGDLGKYAEEDFIISWPDVAEPISGYTIMEAGSFNMSAMVRDNEAFQTIHDLWFLVAKGMMILAFLRLCVRKFNSVVGDRMVD